MLGQADDRTIAGRFGFTLIEVLVVVAIIALLISILLPSLASARNLARLTVDKANCKQIGTMIAEYQTDYRGYVPIMYNYYANGHGQHDAPARACWASVALRNYYPGLKTLKGRKIGTVTFDPEAVWYRNANPQDDQLTQYEDQILPQFWICPFSRGRGRGEVFVNEDSRINAIFADTHVEWVLGSRIGWP